MRAWLGQRRSWLVVEPLPAYAPDLNPVEPLWSNLKGVELANLAGDTLEDVVAAAERGIQRIRGTRIWPSRSCATAVCPYGESSIMSLECAKLF
jgi:transposase